MSDIEDVIQQDQIAESLMSAPVVTDSPTATDTGIEEVEEVQQTDGVQQPVEDEADTWLPSEQDKVFSDEVLLKYAQRYQKDADWLADPLNRQLLTDKINTDIYAAQQKQPIEVEEETRQEPTPPMPTADWLKQVDSIAKQYVSPEVAQWFAGNFLNAFGVKDAPTPEMANQLGNVFTAGVINVLNTVLPPMLNSPMGDKSFFQSLMEQNYEGFTSDYQSEDRAFATATKGIPELQGKSLADVGQQLREAATKVFGDPDLFANAQLKDKNGKELSPYKNTVEKYRILVKAMNQQKLTTAEAKSFMDAGKNAVRKANVIKSAGNLGSGKSNGQIAQKTNANDDIFKEGFELYQREHGRI